MTGRFWRRLGWAALGLGVLGGATGAAFFGGWLVREHEVFPHRLVDRVDTRVEVMLYGYFPADQLTSGDIVTHLITLDMQVMPINPNRERYAHPLGEYGGGLTSFGEDVLLLPYDGRVYASKGPGDIRATEVLGPDMNRAAYQAAADDPAFAHLEFNKGYLRYGDLLFVDSPVFRGLIASYPEYHPERFCYTNTLSRLPIPAEVVSIDTFSAEPGDWEVFFRTEPCLPFKTRGLALEGQMAGGRITFAAPGTLYLTSGDFHFDGMRSDRILAQDPEAQYGAVIEVDLATGASRILSKGHRNPQGITLMPDGRLFALEHGPRGGDELNLIRPGTNYGWPLESLGARYTGTLIPGALSYGRHEVHAPPAFAWAPSIAPSALALVTGFHPAWEGDLLAGSLADRSLHRLRVRNDRVLYTERIEIGSRIRYVHQHSDGRIVLFTDNAELIFLSSKERQTVAPMARFVRETGLSSDLAGPVEVALARCRECHSLIPGDHRSAPSLATIFDGPVADSAYDAYSDALAAQGGRWTREALVAYLTDPQRFAPGTTMPSPGIDDPAAIAAIVDYLAWIKKAI